MGSDSAVCPHIGLYALIWHVESACMVLSERLHSRYRCWPEFPTVYSIARLRLEPILPLAGNRIYRLH